MERYDNAEVGSPERIELGNQLEKCAASVASNEKGFWNVVYAYKARKECKK